MRKGNIYRQPTKLREGNVFSRVCPSVCLSNGRVGGPHVIITHDALDLTSRYQMIVMVSGGPHVTIAHITHDALDLQSWDGPLCT